MLRRLDCIPIDDNRVKFIGLGRKGLMLVDKIRDFSEINVIGVSNRDSEVSCSVTNLVRFGLNLDQPNSYESNFYRVENNLKEALRDNGKVIIIVGDISEAIVSGSIQSLTQLIQELDIPVISMLFSDKTIDVENLGRFRNIQGSHYIHIDSERMGERSFESRFFSIARMLQDCESGVFARYSLGLKSFIEVIVNNRSCEIELPMVILKSELKLNKLIFIKTKSILSRSEIYDLISNMTCPKTNFSWGYKVDEGLKYRSEILIIKGAK